MKPPPSARISSGFRQEADERQMAAVASHGRCLAEEENVHGGGREHVRRVRSPARGRFLTLGADAYAHWDRWWRRSKATRPPRPSGRHVLGAMAGAASRGVDPPRWPTLAKRHVAWLPGVRLPTRIRAVARIRAQPRRHVRRQDRALSADSGGSEGVSVRCEALREWADRRRRPPGGCFRSCGSRDLDPGR